MNKSERLIKACMMPKLGSGWATAALRRGAPAKPLLAEGDRAGGRQRRPASLEFASANGVTVRRRLTQRS